MKETIADAVPAQRRVWELYGARQRRAFLSVLFLIGAANYVDRNIIGVLLEPIKAEFQVSDAMLGLLSGIAFAFFYATLGLPIARWADRGDRKRVITLSLSIWSAMTLLCGFAGTFWQLALARFGVGAGEAGAIPPAQSLLADYYPPARRARAIGIFMLSSSAGYVIGLVLGGLVAASHGWRAAFVVVGLGSLLLAPLAHFALAEPRRVPEFSIRPEGAESVLAGVRALFAKSAYRNILASFVVYFLVAYGALVFIVSFMIRSHALDVGRAGAIYGGISAAGAIIGNIGGGILTDRLAERGLVWIARVAGWGLILVLPCYELALCARGLPVLLPLLLLGSALLAATVPPMFSALHVICGSKRRALAVAVVLFFANLLGLGLGPVIAGALSDYFGASHGAADGLRYSLMVMMTALLPAGWLMHRAGRHLVRNAEA